MSNGMGDGEARPKIWAIIVILAALIGVVGQVLAAYIARDPGSVTNASPTPNFINTVGATTPTEDVAIQATSLFTPTDTPSAPLVVAVDVTVVASETVTTEQPTNPNASSADVTTPTPSVTVVASSDVSSQSYMVEFLQEQEPNDSNSSAQQLELLSSLYPISSRIDSLGDNDWYAFEVEEGKKYLIELFNVAKNIDLKSVTYYCNAVWETYTGLDIIVYDSFNNELARRCAPNGNGNTHTSLEFSAGDSGVHFIQVLAHSAEVGGSYSLRLLPQHNEINATWDPDSLEPNDRKISAYPILIGRENSLSSSIETRLEQYSTTSADIDVYHFEVVEGNTYVVEVFDASSSLTRKSMSQYCKSQWGDYSGLGLTIEDASSEIAFQCAPNGAGDVHTSAQFTADASGIVYAQVYAFEPTVSGKYKIRVLPKYTETEASWDPSTMEPNNVLPNAYPLSVGAENIVTGAIEARTESYSTLNADVDWFYVEAEQGQSFTIDLFDVDSNLSLLPATYYCNGAYGTYNGLGIFVHDPLGNLLAAQCKLTNSGSVHTSLQFTAGAAGPYHIKIFSHSQDVSGKYNLRILSQ